ncbi:uncharacterized protein UTRI_02599_B [Ustilago trichophora]|uniref:Uncharacterized protein n=1 Tax=Ustilago trichophora TaxID=86804 RepID=A0A5C3E4C6_9BASI|nr:uncharacterized protein UTRI_02599_B [Ustilago trichophora]
MQLAGLSIVRPMTAVLLCAACLALSAPLSTSSFSRSARVFAAPESAARPVIEAFVADAGSHWKVEPRTVPSFFVPVQLRPRNPETKFIKIKKIADNGIHFENRDSTFRLVRFGDSDDQVFLVGPRSAERFTGLTPEQRQEIWVTRVPATHDVRWNGR